MVNLGFESGKIQNKSSAQGTHRAHGGQTLPHSGRDSAASHIPDTSEENKNDEDVGIVWAL